MQWSTTALTKATRRTGLSHLDVAVDVTVAVHVVQTLQDLLQDRRDYRLLKPLLGANDRHECCVTAAGGCCSSKSYAR